jgi:hypothetical protein
MIKCAFVKNLRLPFKTVPLALLAACVAAFGLLIPWLGFYQDDWYQIWFGRAYGANVFVNYYAGERPFIALIYMLTTPLIGTTPLAWQIFGLLSRWLAALAVWQLLRLWQPRYSHQTAWAAILFTVYPGFRAHFAAVIYSHYFLQLAIQVLSLAAMLLAILKPRWFWPLMLFSALTAIFGLFTSEYFFGLEFIRPILLWLALGRKNLILPNRIRSTLLYWSPFLAVLLAFVWWRIAVFKFPTYQPFYKQTTAGLIPMITGLATAIGKSILEMGLLTWGMTLKVITNVTNMTPVSLASAGLALAFGIALFLYLLLLDGSKEVEQPPNLGCAFAWPAILLGLFLLLTSGVPFWFVNIKVNTDINEGSRFGISFMLGSALLMVGLIDLLGRRKVFKVALVAGLAGLAVGFHLTDADFYREMNRHQATFFQQLAWRAPGLKPNTLVLVNPIEDFVFNGDNALTATLNWIYEPQPPYSLSYMLFYIPTRLQSDNLAGLHAGQPVKKVLRTATFTGSTDHALVLYYPHPNCLRILDPEVDLDLPRPTGMPRQIQEAIPISNLDQIIADAKLPAELPSDLFMARPDETSWCYFYEKAELARQQKDWEKVVQLAGQALGKNQKYNSTYELLPFIEGLARAGQPEKARSLTMELHRLNPDGREATTKILCSLWGRLSRAANLEQELQQQAINMLDTMQCH